jgi:transposase-like protein
MIVGINVSHTTIYRWVQEYGKLLYQIWKKKNKKSFLFMENGIICIEPSMQMV